MTTKEAIEETKKAMIGAAAAAVKEKDPDKAKHAARTAELLSLIIEAAERGADIVTKAEREEAIEKSKELNEDTIGKAILAFEDAIMGTETGSMAFHVDGARFGIVIEQAMHTALAALRKCKAGMEVDPAADVEADRPDTCDPDIHEEIIELAEKLTGKKIGSAKIQVHVIDMSKIMKDAKQPDGDNEGGADDER